MDIDAAIAQIARVLRPGGAFVVEDSVVPDDPALDRFLNDAEKIRDATHVRSLTAQEWRAKLAAAGLEPAEWTTCPKEHDIADWIARSGLDDAGSARVYEAFSLASADARRQFSIVVEGDRATSFTDEKVIVRAEKAGAPHR